MHRIATKPGDLDSEKKLESVRQTPADILFISTADTELSGLAQVWGKRFRKKARLTLRLMQANPLQHPAAAEHYADNVLCKAKLAIFRLHGGYSYFPHMLDEILHIKSHGAKTRILVLPGTDEWDPELMNFNDYAEPLVRQMFSYFHEGGVDNMVLAAEAVELLLENKTGGFPEALKIPTFGWLKNKSEKRNQKSKIGRVWITFYRALGIKNGVGLILTKGMPSGSGLGSSAASAAAGAYAVNKLFNGGLSEDELILAAMKGEAYVSGGYFADNVAPSILGGATLTQSINPLKVSKLGTIDELILVLIIPNIQILTKDSRDVIPNKIDKRNFITNMANTASITAAFCKNDYALLKDNLIDVIIEPARTKLIPGLADIKSAAVKAGADGCTISGSGPAIFAISNSHQRAKKIKYIAFRPALAC